jgi:hypothetical protein
MLWRRAVTVWFAIMGAEIVHGVLRRLLLVPLVGDLRARQIGVLIGSLIALAIAAAFARWLGARRVREQLAVGSFWAVSTVAFELALGTLLGSSRERIFADYDFAAGGFMAFGIMFLLVSPVLAARIRGVQTLANNNEPGNR